MGDKSIIWRVTSDLRWRLHYASPTQHHHQLQEVRVLEQKWISESGEERWDEIPTVNSEGKPV